ncbi:MAG: (R)-mandelonitrile lyase [Rhodobacterales bacterium]|nr:cupin domain-containing protein [Puniceibacterium antarcticum]
MQITRAGAQATNPGPAAYFTGEVTIEPVPTPGAPSRVNAARVTFQPGARTAWHTHPYGQTLVILSGLGRAQTDGGPVQALNPGDTLFFAPGERHWHGAAPDSALCHLALQEAKDGSAADWLEQVSEAEYSAPPAD